jgi:hypothetical protein
MTQAGANISIPVDLTNPGQFFACCGLLELADRLWPDATGWFEDQRFLIASNDPARGIGALLCKVASAEAEQLDDGDNAASPLRLKLPNSKCMRLDWWQDEATGGSCLKTWAGRQSGPNIFRLMLKAAGRAPPKAPLDYADAIFDSRDGKQNKKTISPFYFDARRAGTALDAGFSADEQQMSVQEFPAVEALAFVGLQRFRPRVDESTPTKSFVYTPWPQPLPPVLAQAVVCGAIALPSSQRYRFTKPSRGGKYAYVFSRAARERSSDA